MNNQEIIDNAPEGATHYDCDEYTRHVHDGFWEYFSKADGWNETKPEEETRSLADIKRIVELEKTCKSRSDTIIEYSNKIAELESMLLSRNKEVGNWILRYDKSGTKQREIIHGQKMHIAELDSILALVKKDLLMRAEEDSEGFKVVDLSSSIWIKLKEALEEQE